ncbi:protease inhibitor I42 family protein [Desulfobulbus sp. TB]|nr:protease inhibitor I42 family protein [Desulfobulbus sp. TB]
MKHLLSITAMIVISLVLSGCGSKRHVEGSNKQVEVGCDEKFLNNKEMSKDITVAVGDEFTLSLCSNATTGYSWSEQANISDTGAIQQVDHAYIAPPVKNPPVMGAAGKEVWTFKAMKKGQNTVYLEYGQPWEGGEKAQKFILTVHVQ